MKSINKPLWLTGVLPTLFLMTTISANLPNPFNYKSNTGNNNYVDNTTENSITRPYYLGGAIGPAEGSGYCSNASKCESKDSAWKLFGGYKVNEIFSAEGSYVTLGDLHKKGQNSDISVIAAHAVASMPVTEQFDVFGKLGAMRWKSENTEGSEDGFGLAYGVGAKMHLSETTNLRAEWEKFPGIETSPTEKTDVDMLSVGFELSTF